MAVKSVHRSKPTSARHVAKKATRAPQQTTRTRSVPQRPARGEQHENTSPASLNATSAPASKQARLIALLQSDPGATIGQMRSLTGWQAHTVRGTISGALRKRLGLNVVCNALTEDGARIYRIVAARASV
jgi:Protein of unknown function (DUF3489)